MIQGLYIARDSFVDWNEELCLSKSSYYRPGKYMIQRHSELNVMSRFWPRASVLRPVHTGHLDVNYILLSDHFDEWDLEQGVALHADTDPGRKEDWLAVPDPR